MGIIAQTASPAAHSHGMALNWSLPTARTRAHDGQGGSPALVAAAPLTALDEAAFRQVKYEDFRRPTTVIGFAGVVLVFSLWIWDWAIDARHAPETFWLRILLSVSILTYPLALMAGVRRWLPLVFYAMLVWLEAVFLLILRRLDGGSVYGMAGFMFWFIVPPLMSFILPLRANILGNLAVLAGSSLLAGPAGLLPEMDLLRLNAILVPACGITVAGHVMIDRLLRRIRISLAGGMALRGDRCAGRGRHHHSERRDPLCQPGGGGARRPSARPTRRCAAGGFCSLGRADRLVAAAAHRDGREGDLGADWPLGHPLAGPAGNPGVGVRHHEPDAGRRGAAKLRAALPRGGGQRQRRHHRRAGRGVRVHQSGRCEPDRL